jgi:hypothetical protein
MIQEAPWGDCKVAYGISDDRGLWRRWQDGRLKADLPNGWTLDQIDAGGARMVAVFRVEGVPTVEQGKAVLLFLRRIHAASRED